MQVDKKQICSHELLFEDCSTCQLEAFCEIENLQKAVTKNIIAPFVRQQDRSWIFTIRPSAEYEEEIGKMTDEYKYGGLVFLGKDGFIEGELPEDWPIYKIVFKGSFEALIGFVCCFIMKYGQSSILPKFGPTVHKDKEIDERLTDIWHWGGSLDECIFKRCSDLENSFSSAYQTHDAEGTEQYFATKDINEFMAGYKKMKDIFIPDTEFYEDEYGYEIQDLPIEYYIHEKRKDCCDSENNDYQDCHNAKPDHLIEKEIQEGARVLPNCKAYFYKL